MERGGIGRVGKRERPQVPDGADFNWRQRNSGGSDLCGIGGLGRSEPTRGAGWCNRAQPHISTESLTAGCDLSRSCPTTSPSRSNPRCRAAPSDRLLVSLHRALGEALAPHVTAYFAGREGDRAGFLISHPVQRDCLSRRVQLFSTAISQDHVPSALRLKPTRALVRRCAREWRSRPQAWRPRTRTHSGGALDRECLAGPHHRHRGRGPRGYWTGGRGWGRPLSGTREIWRFRPSHHNA